MPPDTASIGSGVLAWRHGPGTGAAFAPTADARYRRTERLRVDVPLVDGGHHRYRQGAESRRPADDVAGDDERAARQYAAAASARSAEVSLAPLAPGEYVVELTAAGAGKTDTAVYGFRIVP